MNYQPPVVPQHCVTVLLLVASTFTLACGRSAATRPTCRAPDYVTAQYVGVVRVTLADEHRRRLWRLPEVKPADVRPETDPSICAQAARAMAPMWGERKSRSGPLYVIRVGSAHAVIDRDTGADADGIYYFDSDWTFLSNAFAQ